MVLSFPHLPFHKVVIHYCIVFMGTPSFKAGLGYAAFSPSEVEESQNRCIPQE